MKCVVLGHTKGLGQTLYNHFKKSGSEVIGLSRSNGYDAETNLAGIIEAATGADLFINCSYCAGHQAELVLALKDKVKKIVACGSISRTEPFVDFIDPVYVANKKALADACRLVSISTEPYADVLHIDITFLEGQKVFDPKDPSNFSSDHQIKFSEIIAAVEFWLTCPNVREIEFRWKLTPLLIGSLKRIKKDSELLNDLTAKVQGL